MIVKNPGQTPASCEDSLQYTIDKMQTGELQQYDINPADGLDLTEVAILAVLNNPALKAERTRLQVAGAQVFAAGLLPGPQISTNIDFPTGDTTGAINAWAFGLGPIQNFSRGMKQRLGIARTLVNDLEIIFLDEPTNGLNPKGCRDIHALLKRLNKERQMTIILSTHILDDVEHLCNRIGILHQGRLQCPPAYFTMALE